MSILKRIINYSTNDLERLQEAINAEIERREGLTGTVNPETDAPRLVIAPESPDEDSAVAPRPRRAA